uniref:Peptidase inhibitor 16 n=1 Tax=Leptobrachium leishanense TaxID=445787 RepID=A0A8C5PMJ2_9ANUR
MKPPLWIWIVLHVVFALNEEQKKFIVEKHNVYRSQVDPSASDMMALRWSKSLEDLAKSYAAKCIWEHNENRGLRGENLFLMTGTGLDLELGLGDWYQEHKFYNFTSLECEDGKMCSHYTQMVWADTEKVGCGHHFCEKIKGYDVPKVHFLVCNYEPPGNYIGMKLYKEGSSCANCPAQSVCNGSLCEKDKELEDTSPSPDIIETESQSDVSIKPSVWVAGMTTDPTEMESPEPVRSFGPSLTLASRDDVPDVTTKMVDILVLATEDTSLAHVTEEINPTQLPENDSTSRKNQDAGLTQNAADSRTSPSINNDNQLLTERSSTQFITNTPRSFQSPVTDFTASPLIVTKNGKANTTPSPTHQPSSLQNQMPTDSQTDRQETNTEKDLWTGTATANMPPQISANGAKTTLSPVSTATSTTTQPKAIPSSQHSLPSHHATASPTKPKPTPVPVKTLREQKQKDAPAPVPRPNHKPKAGKAKSQQSTNSVSDRKTNISAQSQKWNILSKSSGCRNAQFTDCFPHVQTFAIFSWSHLADTWYCYWRWKKIIHLAAREDGWTIIHVPS